MFLKLNHQKLDIYGVSRQFVLECYKLETENLGKSTINCFKMLTGIH